MARKYIILFIVLTLIFYSLISSILGERGIIINNQLRRQLKENEYELDRRSVEVENLELQTQELSTEDGLRSAAISLGYQVDSDDVYVFTSEDTQMQIQPSDRNPEAEKTASQSVFKPWNTSFTILISFCASIIITFILWFFRKRDDSDDSEQEESGNIGNDFDID